MKARILMVAAAAAVLTACGGSDAPTGKIFDYSNVAEPKHLDPAHIYDFYEGMVSGLIYDGLLLYDEENNLRPGLAEKWETSDDTLATTFTLREAVFSDGRPVRAADVKYSLTRLLWPETNSERKRLVAGVEGADEVASGTTRELRGIETPADRVVVIRLSRPDPAFLTKLAMPNAAIIPEGAAGTDKPLREFDRKPIGTGPWVLSNWQRDQRLEFLPNKEYWDGAPLLDGFNFHVQANDRVVQQQFEVGNFDIYAVGFTVWPQWRTDPAKVERMIPLQELNTYYIGIMCSKPALKDKRVRQAISHAIDTEAVFRDLQKERGVHSSGPVPPTIDGYREEKKPRTRDLDLARKLLAEAGAEGLTLNYWYTPENLTGEIARLSKENLEQVGLKVNLIRRDSASFRQGVYNGEPDLYHYSWWLDCPDIEDALRPSFHSSNIPYGGNGAHYSNPEFDRLLDEAATETNAERRISLLQQAEDIVREDCPWVFLYHRKSFIMVQPWVKNYTPAGMYNAGKYHRVDMDLPAGD